MSPYHIVLYVGKGRVPSLHCVQLLSRIILNYLLDQHKKKNSEINALLAHFAHMHKFTLAEHNLSVVPICQFVGNKREIFDARDSELYVEAASASLMLGTTHTIAPTLNCALTAIPLCTMPVWCVMMHRSID